MDILTVFEKKRSNFLSKDLLKAETVIYKTGQITEGYRLILLSSKTKLFQQLQILVLKDFQPFKLERFVVCRVQGVKCLLFIAGQQKSLMEILLFSTQSENNLPLPKEKLSIYCEKRIFCRKWFGFGFGFHNLETNISESTESEVDLI